MSKCSICEQPTRYAGRDAAVNLRGGRQAHISCVQRKRGWTEEQIERHARQRMATAGETTETWAAGPYVSRDGRIARREDW